MKSNLKYYLFIIGTCTAIFALALYVRPHQNNYGPPPYFYNPDISLWVSTAENIKALKGHTHANRPITASLGWLFAQPVNFVLGDAVILTPTKVSGIKSVRVSAVVGLLLKNLFLYTIASIFLYHITYLISGNKRIALFSSLMWTVSSFAFSWSYHPTGAMEGVCVVSVFSFFLLSLNKTSSYKANIFFGLGFGLLLLIKEHYAIPLIYLLWGIINKFKMPVVLAGFVFISFPILLWRGLYKLIAGSPVVAELHIGAGSLSDFISSKLLTIAGIKELILLLMINFVELPRMLFNPTGIFVSLAAIGFYLNPTYRREYRHFCRFSGIYFILFFIYLTIAFMYMGNSIPCRHGSDFIPFLYPAAAIFMYDILFKLKSKVVLYTCFVMFILYTIVSYTHAWICATNVM